MIRSLGDPYITKTADASFDSANRLIQRDNESYSYDKNGNRTSKNSPQGDVDYRWDSRNRLTHIVSSDGSTAEFKYDAYNNLISQTLSTATQTLETRYLVDDLNNVVRYDYSDGSWLSVTEAREIDDHLSIASNDGTVLFIGRDAINSTVITTDNNGSLHQSFSYEPYDEAFNANLGFPIQYTGRMPVLDGLYYYRTRIYDPVAGAFIQSDPIGTLGGINQYSYVFGNPINYTDPNGLFACGGLCIGGIAVGTVAIIHWTRNFWNESVTDISDVNDWTELTPGESVFHRMGPGNENNRKFVSPDGRSEAVFDSCGNMVTDPANEGTYNFFGPRTLGGVPHGIFDVIPYYVFGNSPGDMFNPDCFIKTYELLTR